jgi:hypothetical protein
VRDVAAGVAARSVIAAITKDEVIAGIAIWPVGIGCRAAEIVIAGSAIGEVLPFAQADQVLARAARAFKPVIATKLIGAISSIRDAQPRNIDRR